jgi:Na+/alanine symporter
LYYITKRFYSHSGACLFCYVWSYLFIIAGMNNFVQSDSESKHLGYLFKMPQINFDCVFDQKLLTMSLLIMRPIRNGSCIISVI